MKILKVVLANICCHLIFFRKVFGRQWYLDSQVFLYLGDDDNSFLETVLHDGGISEAQNLFFGHGRQDTLRGEFGTRTSFTRRDLIHGDSLKWYCYAFNPCGI